LDHKEAMKRGLKPFRVTGHRAHRKPKKHLDFTRIVYARDAVHALEIYKRRLKGVKKHKYCEVTPL